MQTTLHPDTCLSGSWQMALDAALLQRRAPALRFYRFSGPTLSLGFHQRHWSQAWQRWQAQADGQVVRRPSGGGAVLHGGDLCYALVWPDPGCSRRAAYRQVCRWLQQAFAALGEELRFGVDDALIEPDCFARSTPADLLNADGQKRIGSAQRWHQGCLLQHGSIQLNPDQALWPLLLDHPGPQLAPLGRGADELSLHLGQAAAHWLNLSTDPRPFDAELLSAAAGQLERYRVTSPLASMDLTT